MAQFKVVITDFGSPENELEANELRNSGLDIELVRLNAKTPQELLPHVADDDGLIVQLPREVVNNIVVALQGQHPRSIVNRKFLASTNGQKG